MKKHLTVVSQEFSTRLLEVQQLLTEIRAEERASERSTSQGLNVKKGLFLVLLYGALEYAITRLVTEVSLVINGYRVEHRHLHDLLHALALDPELRALVDAGRKQKWKKRRSLFERQFSSAPIDINTSAVGGDIENVWDATIRHVFDVFGLQVDHRYDVRVRQYVDELVEKRNAVAHGRESAADVGQRYSSSQLGVLAREIENEVQYVIQEFEELLVTKRFIRGRHRRYY